MSYGQEILLEYLRLFFNNTKILIDYRPDWLFGMELDFFIPEYNIAFEFQGLQHYEPIYGSDSLVNQQARDISKKEICISEKIAFVCVDAIDLEYTKMRGLIRKGAKFITKCLSEKKLLLRGILKKEINRDTYLAINSKAIDYRKTLRKHKDITALKKKTRKKMARDPNYKPYSY
jgi:hypothetical protein